MTRFEQALFDAAWEQFKRMPSSNPSDYVNALLPLIRRRTDGIGLVNVPMPEPDEDTA